MESKVLIAKQYGNADVLEIATINLPALAPGFARIEVKAAGINPIDARRMTGEFKFGPLPQTFGTEYAGIISAIENNETFKVGDAVLGSGGAFTHATVIDVPIANLVHKPENMTWEVAGSIAGVAQTAMTILQELGPVKTLLIHGGSGGVGSITIQLAKELGIEVLATASAENQAYLKSIGAVPFIYNDDLVQNIKTNFLGTIDASVDMAGTEQALQASLALVKPNGKITTIAGKPLSSPRAEAIWVKRNVTNLKYVVEGVANGKFHWAINASYPFKSATTAYTNVLKGHAKGKNVLQF